MNPLSISIINVEDLNLAHRIDAEHYQPHYLEIVYAVQRRQHKKLSEVVSKTITTGHTPSMKEDRFYGGSIKFVKTDNLRDNHITDDFSHYLSDEGSQKLKNSALKPDDILITIIGATYEIVGRVARVFADLGPAHINQNIALVRSTLPAGYLTCFLLGKYGKQQLYYLSRQTEQVNLNNAEVGDVLVPIPSDGFAQHIHKLHNQMHKLQLEAKGLYDDAERLLLDELDLAVKSFTTENVSVRNLSECVSSGRFDAEYWQPKYDEIEERVSKIAQKQLGEIVSVKKGVEVGSEAYEDEGKDFVRVSDFSIYGIDDVEKKISSERYAALKDAYKPKKGEVLFTKDGTIGITFALNDEIEAIVSGAFLRLKPNVDVNTGYLALVLNSFYCKSQIERMSGGAIIAHLKPESAMQIKVPMLPKQKQDELASKVSDALRLRGEARQLLEKAKRAVEVFVEKDEKEALALLTL